MSRGEFQLRMRLTPISGSENYGFNKSGHQALNIIMSLDETRTIVHGFVIT